VSALELIDVGRTIDGRVVLHDISLSVAAGEHWVVIGPNGSGKSTLLKIAGLQLHPSSGRVIVLGTELGTADIRTLRSSIGITSAALVDQLRGSLTGEEVVRCGRFAALEPWWHDYDESDTERAVDLLRLVGVPHAVEQPFVTLSSGERQRVLLARSLMAEPAVLLLDEPTAGLDFIGREQLIASLDALAESGPPATVFVTHHLEDVPTTTTHLLAIADGTALAAGPIEDVLNEALLAEVFGMPVRLTRQGSRWSAAAASPSSSSRMFNNG
jgi:iron complex transport system ATP-binding protein